MKSFFRIRSSWFQVIAFVSGCLPYLNTISHEFVWDDKLVILENEVTRAGLDGLPEIWTTPAYIAGRDAWRPLTQSTHAWMWEFFGDNPLPEHLLNILIFGLCSLALYRFGKILFMNSAPSFVLLAAIVFAVHPVHTEVVANVKGRDELLSFLFSILALTLYLHHCRKNSKWRHYAILGSIFLFVLAMLSKFNSVTMLAFLPFGVWWCSPSGGRRPEIAGSLVIAFGLLGFAFYSEWIAALSILPAMFLFHRKARSRIWLGVAFLILPVSFYFFRNDAGPYDMNRSTGIATEPGILNNVLFGAEGTSETIGTTIAIMGKYILLLFYPHPLVQSYGYNQFPIHSFSHPAAWLSLLVLLVMTFFLWKGFRKQSPWLMGLVLFLTGISIYSEIFELTADTLAERNLFLPSAGFCLAVAMVFESISGTWGATGNFREYFLIGFAGFPIVVFFVLTIDRNRDWRNDLTLSENTIGYMENNAVAYANLGHHCLAYSIAADSPAEQLRYRRKTFEAWSRALEIYPGFESVKRRLYQLYMDVYQWNNQNGYFPAAEEQLRQAIMLDSSNPAAFFALGKLSFRFQKWKECAHHMEEAIGRGMNDSEAWFMKANSHLALGDTMRAKKVAAEGIERFATRPEFYALTAVYSLYAGDLAQAESFGRMALFRDPGFEPARQVMKNVFESKGVADSAAIYR